MTVVRWFALAALLVGLAAAGWSFLQLPALQQQLAEQRAAATAEQEQIDADLSQVERRFARLARPCWGRAAELALETYSLASPILSESQIEGLKSESDRNWVGKWLPAKLPDGYFRISTGISPYLRDFLKLHAAELTRDGDVVVCLRALAKALNPNAPESIIDSRWTNSDATEGYQQLRQLTKVALVRGDLNWLSLVVPQVVAGAKQAWEWKQVGIRGQMAGGMAFGEWVILAEHARRQYDVRVIAALRAIATGLPPFPFARFEPLAPKAESPTQPADEDPAGAIREPSEVEIALSSEGVSINGEQLHAPTVETFSRLFGPADRTEENMDRMHTYDRYGLLLYEPYDGKVKSALILLSPSDRTHDPAKTFSGRVTLDGQTVSGQTKYAAMPMQQTDAKGYPWNYRGKGFSLFVVESKPASLVQSVSIHFDHGPPTAKTHPRESVCRSGDADACFSVALEFNKGEFVAEDHVKALEFSDLACAGDVALACFQSARWYRDGIGTEAAPDKSKHAFKRACDLGLQLACGK
jgi:hypothetical protein